MNANNENSKNSKQWDKIAKSLFQDNMQSINTDTIAWGKQSWLRTVDTFNAECPTCDQLRGVKTDSSAIHDQACKTISQSAICTFCGQHFKVFVINPLIDQDLNKPATCDSVWAYPTASVLKKLIFTEEDLTPRIFRSYKSAIDSFNNKNWFAVLSSCGVTLEGICKIHFPKAKNGDTLGDLFGKLDKLLKTDSQYSLLLEPMKLLGEALNLGRHKGAHFDIEKDPDKEVAVRVLDATEFLIKYFYTLKKDAETLKKKILALKPENFEGEISEDSA